MSQITRCPSCQTCFKVVADQLRISDGWVRCGHCKQVFDATEQLQQVQPAALMPDLPLDSLRAPVQPVARSADAPHVWGTERRPSAGRASTFTATAPQAITERPAPVPSLSSDESRLVKAPDPEVPVTPERRAVPAFLSRDMAEPVMAAPFAWRAPVAPAVVQPAESADAHLTEEGGLVPGPGAPLMGYELPGSVEPENDILEPPGFVGSETGVAVTGLSEPQETMLEAVEPHLESDPDQTRAAQTEPTTEASGVVVPSPWEDWGEDAAELKLMPGAAALPRSGAVQGAYLPPPASTGASADGDSPPPDGGTAPQVASPLPIDSAVVEPSFVRAARRRDFWRKPLVRVALGGLCAALCALLLLQVAVQQRSWLAAAQPQWRPLLSDLCGLLHCQLGPYRDIAAVVVDSSSFNKERGDSYQFALTLKNHSNIALETPAIELTLTDAQDQAVLRRVFFASDLAAPAQLAARGDWSASVQMGVSAPDARITGYRVLAFYP